MLAVKLVLNARFGEFIDCACERADLSPETSQRTSLEEKCFTKRTSGLFSCLFDSAYSGGEHGEDFVGNDINEIVVMSLETCFLCNQKSFCKQMVQV